MVSESVQMEMNGFYLMFQSYFQEEARYFDESCSGCFQSVKSSVSRGFSEWGACRSLGLTIR